MSSPDLPPLQSEPVPPSQTAAQPRDTGFTFRIARVQEWTLGAVVAAAVGFGVWMGTLNTKLEHIEKFVDAANDGSTGVFTRLATIQATLDLVDRSNSQQLVKGEKTSAVEVRVVPFAPSPAPTQTLNSGATQSQISSLDVLLEYKLIQQALEEDRKASESRVAGDAQRDSSTNNSVAQTGSTLTTKGHDTPSKSSNTTEENTAWLADLKETALADLERLKADVNANKRMKEATRKELLGLIEAQEQRIKTPKE